MGAYVTPCLDCDKNNCISKKQRLSVHYSLHALLPLVISHGLSFFLHGLLLKGGYILYCFPIALIAIRTVLRQTQERPRNINGPFWLTCASHRAVDPPTALSAVRLVLSDTRPSLANLYVDRINRMGSSRHVVLWDCVGERSGGRTIDTSPATACLLPRLSIVRVSAIIKRWSCLAMDSCRVGPQSWSLAPYDSVTGTGDILHLKPVHQSLRERVP